jgi:hypothetical protein
MKRTRPEQAIQRAVFEHLRARGAPELKAEGERATDKQLETIAALREAGAFTAIAEGLDRALAVLKAWGLLRGRAS